MRFLHGIGGNAIWTRWPRLIVLASIAAGALSGTLAAQGTLQDSPPAFLDHPGHIRPSGTPAAVTPASLRRVHPDADDTAEGQAAPQCWTRLAGEPRPLTAGHVLMQRGDIVGARRHFTECLDQGLPEAALALASSYDPEYLAGIRTPNARPDVALARSWYAEWHRLAVAHGDVSEAMRIDRLLEDSRPGR